MTNDNGTKTFEEPSYDPERDSEAKAETRKLVPRWLNVLMIIALVNVCIFSCVYWFFGGGAIDTFPKDGYCYLETRAGKTRVSDLFWLFALFQQWLTFMGFIIFMGWIFFKSKIKDKPKGQYKIALTMLCLGSGMFIAITSVKALYSFLAYLRI